MLETPRERCFRTGGIARQKARAEMRNAPEFALADRLTRVLDHGSPTVVESDERENTGVSRDTLDFSCFCRTFSYRLFAEDVFAGCRRCGCEFQVPMVGCSTVDHLHVGIANHILPLRGMPFEPETLLSFLRTGFDFIGADDEPGSDPAVGEAIGGLKVRSAVCRSHPACSDDSYADDLCHAEPCQTFSLKQIEFPSEPHRCRISRGSEALRRERCRPDHDRQR